MQIYNNSSAIWLPGDGSLHKNPVPDNQMSWAPVYEQNSGGIRSSTHAVLRMARAELLRKVQRWYVKRKMNKNQ